MKKAQAAAGAAVLLAVIAGVIIFFVILVPPQERAKLLDEEGIVTDSGNVSDIFDDVEDKNLLLEKPGRIDYLAQKKIGHSLPVVTIYTKKESLILAEKGFVSAKRAIFTEKEGEFHFAIDDLSNTESVLLSFNVRKAEGELLVFLNGEEVFQGEVEEGSIPPLNLPKNMLQKQNVVTFGVSSPGVAFWLTHAVSIDDLKVVGEVTNVDAQYSENVFLVSKTEKENLEKVVLKFQPDCIFSDVGKLRVMVNAKEIYSAVPDCALKMVPIEFSPSMVMEGENRLIFYTEKGTYQLSHAVIESNLKEVDFPTFYFELSHEEFKSIENDKKRARLKINFVDVVDSKKGDLVFNGHLTSFDTKEVEYVLDLSEDVVKGNNALKIKPKKTLELRELRVDLIE